MFPPESDISRDAIYACLAEIKDPEIPVLSLTDLGVIRDVGFHDDMVKIILTPTFVGCPAIQVMRDEIVSALQKKGFDKVEVELSFREPWTSDMISEQGRQAIRKFGLAPPPPATLIGDINVLENAPCPRCNGTDTELRNAFGATLCRAIHYCNQCQEAFEQFKPI